MRKFWQSGVEKLSDTLSIPLGNRNTNTGRKAPPKQNNLEYPSTIVFVLSLSGRFQTFLRFLKNYEHICLKHPDTKTELLITLFHEKNIDLLPYYNEMEKLQRKYPKQMLKHIEIGGKFSRGIALNTAARSNHIQMDDIIFFIDVDMVFNRVTLDRIRLNTIKHKQVYFPIVFSQYNPKRWLNQTSTTVHSQFEPWTASTSNLNQNIPTTLDLGYETGYFRQFGYGICSIYKSDVLHPDIDGFNTDINGWGLEDVKFLEKIIKLNQKPNILLVNTAEAELHKDTANQPNDQINKMNDKEKSPASAHLNNSPTASSSSSQTSTSNIQPAPITLSIFRAPDPTLVHIYHDIHCDKTSLNESSQYQMCLGTKANTLGSYKYIESLFLYNRTIIDFISSVNGVR